MTNSFREENRGNGNFIFVGDVKSFSEKCFEENLLLVSVLGKENVASRNLDWLNRVNRWRKV